MVSRNPNRFKTEERDTSFVSVGGVELLVVRTSGVLARWMDACLLADVNDSGWSGCADVERYIFFFSPSSSVDRWECVEA